MRFLATLLILSLTACLEKAPPEKPSLFGSRAPVHPRFKDELKYLATTGILSANDLQGLESSISNSAQAFSVPQPVVWCLLFQESRFDRLKNILETQGARGLGQFTPNALAEINKDTGFFHSKTPQILASLKQAMPITFEYKLAKRSAPNKAKIPDRSYFQERSGVNASTAYLMNRYSQLKRHLDRAGVQYNTDVLWIYAIAAYNKGARTIHMLLRFQLRHGGREWVSRIMTDPELTFRILQDELFLSRSFKYIWQGSKRQKLYARELSLHMKSFQECAIREGGV